MTELGLGIVDADRQFGARLAGFLGDHGFAPELHGDTGEMLARLSRKAPQIVLIGDQREATAVLPAIRRLRTVSRIPCIVVASAVDDATEAVLLEAGADALVDRRIPFRAMLARIRAVLRRAEWGGGAGAPGPGSATIGWRLLPQRRQLLRPDGSECPLTTAEFDLMALLLQHQGRSVSRDLIAQDVFRRPFRAEDRTVDNLVLRLRRKLGPDQQDSIRTVRGAGYLFGGFNEAIRRVA